MHHEVITSEMSDLLLRFDAGGLGDNFGLVGGTNLALRFGHRISHDLDFFSTGAESELPDQRAIINLVDGIYPVTATLCQSDQVWYSVGHTNVTFLQYPFSFVDTPLDRTHETSGMPMVSILDVAATKASTIGRRAAARDYADLWVVIRNEISLKDIVQRAEMMFNTAGEKNFSPKLFVKQLTYYDDLDATDVAALDEQLRHNTSWNEIVEGIEAVVYDYVHAAVEPQTHKSFHGKYGTMKLPDHLAPLFWNNKFDAMDTDANANTIIERILLFGEIDDWQWLWRCYGEDRIRLWVAENIDTTLVYFDKDRVFWAAILLNKTLAPTPPKERWKSTRMVNAKPLKSAPGFDHICQ